uniref:NADH-ubiquinone oxidoreductase chain 2 n=1 Tax=Diaphorina lycii TaxID=2047824 RepID=A0A343M3A4_9HEMI|nr:NADH dehydrogenase subunit 2 [Diaphorina lycii]ATR80183.1 NADH dehydrogenase subunit 2 [Diaphorina lycii]
MKKFNFIIFPTYMLSIILSLSSSSWMMIWMGLEINLLSFVFILIKPLTYYSLESTMKYFLIQSVGSLIFLLTISINMIYFNEMSTINAILPPLALTLKSGMAPLHIWTPDILEKFNYFSFLLFITMQKLVPLFILYSSWMSLTPWICVCNLIMGSIGGITQSSIRKMVAFSSISNSGWMMMALSHSHFFFTLFFVIYFITNMLVVIYMKKTQNKWLTQIKPHQTQEKMFFYTLMLSLSGMPPLLGFLPKWMVIKKISIHAPIICLTSILFSLFTLFFYIKCAITTMMKFSEAIKWKMKYPSIKKPFLFFLLMNMFSPLLFVLLT